jgi:Kef-type K+ transport system membrane component KefB
MEITTGILADLFVLFVAARLAGTLFARLKQPAVIGELLVGVLIGPHVLGWVGTPDPAMVEAFHGDAAAAQAAVSLVFDLFAELGVIILLFFVGLETRLSDLLGVGGRAIAVGALGIAAPFAAGYAFMVLRGTTTTEALFVATALVATSSGITARVLRDLGILHAREARIILGAAIVDDVLAMILLATVNQFGPRGRLDVLEIGLIAAQAVGFIVFVVLIGTRTLRQFSAHLERLPFTHAPLVVALAMMLGLATIAGAVGLAAIIGAFLAGMVMAQEAERFALEDAVVPIYEFLVPFFFVIIGTRVDPALFLDGRVMGGALAITVVAIIAKLAGAGLGGLGLGGRAAAIIGVGMVPRGEVGLIVASLGLSRGLIGAEYFSTVVVMSILTTLIVPPLLAWLGAPLVRQPGPTRGERMGAAGRLPQM